jgi:hypothetical protein
MHYLNPNQMKPNCFTYCKIYTNVHLKKLFGKYFHENIYFYISFFEKFELFGNNFFKIAK